MNLATRSRGLSHKIYTSIIWFFLLVFTFSCGSHKKSAGNDTSQDNTSKTLVAEIGPFPKTNDPYEIKQAKIKGNLLEIEVSYGGGCQEHDFTLIGSNAIAKSLPPIRSIQLAHDSKGDKCEAIVTKKLTFDITKLAYNTNPGSKIKLQLDNYTETLEYSYE